MTILGRSYGVLGVFLWGLNASATLDSPSYRARLTFFQQGVQLAQVALLNAKTYDEYRGHQDNVLSLLEGAQEIRNSNQREDAQFAFCATLSTLSSRDLVNLQELTSHKGFDSLPCSNEVVKTIDQYWAKSLSDFQATGLASTVKDIPTLPQSEYHVDTATAGTLTRGGLKDGEILLTFDDGPHVTNTPKILAALKKAGIRANFFAIGKNAKNYPAVAKKIVEDGHILGSHSHDHQAMSSLSHGVALANIQKGHTEVKEAAGEIAPFFRFPYGASTRALNNALYQKSMAIYFWNMDTLDWKYRDVTQLYRSIISNLNREKGGIMLMHDIQPQTVAVLPSLLVELGRRKFQTYVFVPH